MQDDSVHKCTKTDTKEQSGTKDVGADGCIHAYRHTRTVPPIPEQSDTPKSSQTITGFADLVARGEVLRRCHPLLALRSADHPVALDCGLPALERFDHLARNRSTGPGAAGPPPAVTCDMLIGTGEDLGGHRP